MSRVPLLIVRLGSALALVLVATLYLLASIPFAYYHFLQFPHFSWMPAFIRFHPIVLAAAVAYPFFASPFFTYQIGAQSLALGLIALSLTFLGGYGGMVSLAQMTIAGLAILTLLAMAVGYIASITGVLGRRSRYFTAICYSATFLFHLIPGVTETLTRLPVGAPVFASAEAPGLRPIYAVMLVVFAVAVFFQIQWLRGEVNKVMAGQVPA